MKLTDDQASRISADGLIHDAERLKELQALPLYRKIGISIARIIEWYQYWNGNVYVAFSGGKDSTVLLHLVRSMFPDVPAVFSNTGLEYPEVRQFAQSFPNVVTVYPKINFQEVLTSYGYPLISKEVSEAIYYARRIIPQKIGGGAFKTKTAIRKRLELLELRSDSGRRLPNEPSFSENEHKSWGGGRIQSAIRIGIIGAGHASLVTRNSLARNRCSTKKSGSPLQETFPYPFRITAAMS